ncbi:unannotated protein [freshwater metagenome]|uniref:Unannotated protein n=1 Tax=freshwater metagenome TaxID=449393 RepID=A0A6J7GEK1_9ZZZZ
MSVQAPLPVRSGTSDPIGRFSTGASGSACQVVDNASFAASKDTSSIFTAVASPTNGTEQS